MQTLEPASCIAEETTAAVWTPERVELLTRLWEEGVPTAEMGRQLGVTKNAALGKVHRIGLTPRIVKEPPAPLRNIFDYVGAVCMWPIGHPCEEDFHFCGRAPLAGKPYCGHHAALAYVRPKDKAEAAERAPESYLTNRRRLCRRRSLLSPFATHPATRCESEQFTHHSGAERVCCTH